ncbi:MAG: nickel-responsive transcriptional regulator NikR [Thermoplasmata archaeon]|nr:nickel-responsive transcriptional regulator NikR [Thermoplasmata archaeon]
MCASALLVTMSKKTRISVTVSEEVLKEFDSLSDTAGQPTRSKAVDEAMREFITNRMWDTSRKGSFSGVILVTYDHHSRGVNRALTELQHDYHDIVSATMHIHLSKHTCLEVIAFKGQGTKVQSLARMIQSQKGVLDLKLITSHA